MAVSLGETFSGPKGFSNTASSSNLSCCISCALNSSTPSNASARCWNDEVSNLLHCLQESEYSSPVLRSPPVSEDVVDGVFGVEMGNSTILSILGAFTDTSRESTLQSRLMTLCLCRGSSFAGLFDTRGEDLRADCERLLTGVCETGSCRLERE
nr:hypothetical protein Itr_chr07CG01390 [Ipomoea trifida]